jgi:hypothetical protein
MKRQQDEIQKTAKDEVSPNSLLSLPKDILLCCVAFVGKDTIDLWVAYVKKINKSYENEHNNNKKPFGNMLP